MNPFMLLLNLIGLISVPAFSARSSSASKLHSLEGWVTDSEEDEVEEFVEIELGEELANLALDVENGGASIPIMEDLTFDAAKEFSVPIMDDDPLTPDTGEPPEIVAVEQTGGTGDDGGSVEATDLAGSVSVMQGRVTTLNPGGDDIASVRIVSDVEHGNVTVNPDNTLALVLTKSDFVGQQSFSYEITYANGSTSVETTNLNVVPGAQAGGWGTGENHYMLATDENDKVIVEAGDNHQKVHITGSNDGLSIQDIANMEGIPTGHIDGNWLANSQYGSTEALALNTEAGQMKWQALTPEGTEASHWLLLEKGYQYDLGRIIQADVHGESEIHPMYVSSYGEGARPDITSYQMIFQETSSNVVFQDLKFSGEVFILNAENLLFDNVEATLPISQQGGSGLTIRNSEFLDIVRPQSQNGGDWEQHADRISGFYSDQIEGLLFEGNLFDKIAWEEGYDHYLSGSAGMPPSMYSQNIYINASNLDVTMRDTITMRGASFGAQIRSGGFIEDTVFLDNNAAFASVGGDYNGAGPVGNYTLFSDNLITSGAHKDALQIGALTQGLYEEGELATYVDTIVTHLADPNSNELDWKLHTHDGFHNNDDLFYDDTIVYNWKGSETVWGDIYTIEQNTEGLDTAALDQTTIQLFTAQLTGNPNATIGDLADYLRARVDGQFDDMVDADLIIRFFQEGFGIAPDIRDTAETLRFVPDDLGDGVRWDNRLNWDTEDLPGLFATDNADLGGNDVVFGTNAEINALDMGPDGSLNIYGGKLTLNGGVTGDDGGMIHLEGAGQLWTDGADAANLDVVVDGGRFVNTGDMAGANLTANDGEVILASENGTFELSSGDTLTVGAGAEVGFDGENGDMAILDLEDGATVAFDAEGNSLGSISEFHSGAFNNSGVKSGINLGNADLTIDLTGLSAEDGAGFLLMDADEIVGIFDDASVSGLGGRDATILVDYIADKVTLIVSHSGNGNVAVRTVGDQGTVESDEVALWNALTEGQGVASDIVDATPQDDDLIDDAA